MQHGTGVKYPILFNFIVHDFLVNDDTLFKTCAYAESKCPADAQKVQSGGNYPLWHLINS
ncbi:hypothetical protein B6A42_23745 [Vibrio coralliilyticus]|nr:hypothetical protein B6A42_23745 [Vibrio coralliilyticus]